MAGDELDDGLEYSFSASPSSPHELEDGELIASDSEQNQKQEPQGQETKEQKKNPKPKKQKKPNQKKKDEKKAVMEAQVEKKKQLGLMEPSYIADYIVSRVAGAKELSSMELQDQSVAQAQIVDCSEWSGSRDISRLPIFIKEFNIVESGSLAVVLHISAIRACDACRSLRSLKMPIGKLIPKNKPKQDEALLAKNPKLVVATPGRIRRLIADGILKADSVAKVIVEGSFIDKKANSVFDLPETIPVLNTLSKNGAKVYVF